MGEMAMDGKRDAAVLAKLTDAVVALDPQPRERRWTSLSFCIVDAVWSIGANYDNVVVPLVRKKFAAKFGVTEPTVPASEPVPEDPLPLSRLDALTVDSLTALTNRQRTSTRGGIRKADAVLQHVAVFRDHRVETMQDALALFSDLERFDQVDEALRSIPGEGSFGIRRNYLWMAIGQDDLIKPDRMVLRWLDRHDVKTDPAGARDIIAALVPAVSQKLKRAVTAWEIDHVLWLAGRKKPG
jgi:hypothetical protein